MNVDDRKTVMVSTSFRAKGLPFWLRHAINGVGLVVGLEYLKNCGVWQAGGCLLFSNHAPRSNID
jgi:hypothetical protein